jgi:hypothetical protein
MARKIDKHEKQARIAVITICIVIASFLLVWSYVKSLDNFSYGGIQFKKTSVGDITVYQSKDYFFPAYRLNFRVDPRENMVPVLGKVRIRENIIVSSSNQLRVCEGIAKPYADLIFFYVFAGGNLSEATLNKTEAGIKNLNYTYADCENAIAGTSVIKIDFANQTSIEQDSKYKNCYNINLNNCSDFDAVVERFIMAAVAGYQGKEL